eukprot:UN4732
MLIADLPLDDDVISSATGVTLSSTSLTDRAYLSVPLSDFSPSARGRRLEHLTRLVDGKLHPGVGIQDPQLGARTTAHQRHSGSARYDWLRGEVRVECKSSQLYWIQTRCEWHCNFTNVKFAQPGLGEHAFDDLLLALYTPLGIYIFRHDFALFVSSAGRRTSARGHNIQVSGPRGEADVNVALQAVLHKLSSGGCKQLALIEW